MYITCNVGQHKKQFTGGLEIELDKICPTNQFECNSEQSHAQVRIHSDMNAYLHRFEWRRSVQVLSGEVEKRRPIVEGCSRLEI